MTEPGGSAAPDNDARSSEATQERTVVAVIVVCCVALALGFLFKARCLPPEAFQRGDQYLRLCYNDIQPLFGIRAIATDTFPYVSGEFTADHQLIGGAIEYPVLTGVFMWAAGLLTEDSGGYLRVTALLMAPFGILAAYLLARMAGWRALMFAAAPAIVFYAFHNWDLLSVAATVAGLYAWWRGKPLWAAVAFGVGAALKLHPIAFVVPLVIERFFASGTRAALRTAGVGFGTALLVNLPFMLINFDGWWATYEFHSIRPPNYDSMWNLAATRFPDVSLFHMPALNLVTAVATVGTGLVVLIYSWDVARRTGTYPFLQVCAAFLAAFMLWNKVHSPQYTLWLLPFFVVLNVNVLWWLAYSLIDALVYVGVFRWFFDIVYLQLDDTPAKAAMVWGVWGRAALLAILIVVFMRARRAPDPTEEDAMFFRDPRVSVAPLN